MDFIEYTQNWAKSEVLQGRIMIGVGVVLLIGFISILRSNHELLRGSVIPLGILIAIFIGYGGFILYSRPAHAKESIALYQKSDIEALEKEREKHINDNKAGNTLLKFVYPGMILAGLALLILAASPYFKGMGLGFALLGIAAYVMDYGFVSRSDAFLSFLKNIQ